MASANGIQVTAPRDNGRGMTVTVSGNSAAAKALRAALLDLPGSSNAAGTISIHRHQTEAAYAVLASDLAAAFLQAATSAEAATARRAAAAQQKADQAAALAAEAAADRMDRLEAMRAAGQAIWIEDAPTAAERAAGGVETVTGRGRITAYLTGAAMRIRQDAISARAAAWQRDMKDPVVEVSSTRGFADEGVRAGMKELGARWDSERGCWMVRVSRVEQARELVAAAQEAHDMARQAASQRAAQAEADRRSAAGWIWFCRQTAAVGERIRHAGGSYVVVETRRQHIAEGESSGFGAHPSDEGTTVSLGWARPE